MASVNVTILAGGPSPEAEVSRTSAAAVGKALDSAGHHVEAVEVDAFLPQRLGAGNIDVVFPVLHGPLGEDGCIQGLLEVLGLPYVGCGVLASAIGASKPHAKVHFRAAGLPVADEAVITRCEPLLARVREVRSLLGPRVVIKPSDAGSALGVTRIDESMAEAVWVEAVETAFSMGSDALVETFEAGCEVTCGVLEDDAGRPQALPPTLVLAKAAGWYDFKSRYAPGGSEHTCPAPFDAELTGRLQAATEQAHRAIGARDLSRSDFVVDVSASKITLLEINTMPGMTATSLFPEAAAVSGIDFIELCNRLVQRAAARPRRSGVRVVPMPC